MTVEYSKRAIADLRQIAAYYARSGHSATAARNRSPHSRGHRTNSGVAVERTTRRSLKSYSPKGYACIGGRARTGVNRPQHPGRNEFRPAGVEISNALRARSGTSTSGGPALVPAITPAHRLYPRKARYNRRKQREDCNGRSTRTHGKTTRARESHHRSSRPGRLRADGA